MTTNTAIEIDTNNLILTLEGVIEYLETTQNVESITIKTDEHGSEKVCFRDMEFDLDIDAFSTSIKNAIIQHRFDFAKKMLSMFEYNIYFEEKDQTTILIDSKLEDMRKILRFFFENDIDFVVYDFTVIELIVLKAHDKLYYLFQNDCVKLEYIQDFLFKAFSQNDGISMKLIAMYVNNSETIDRFLESVCDTVYKKKKGKYIKFKTLDALKVFLNSENVKNMIQSKNIESLIYIAGRTSDTDVYSYIIRHPLFSEKNLVFSYIDRACLEFDVNTSMITYLLDSDVSNVVIKNGLLTFMRSPSDMPYCIYELFVNDPKNILFNALNNEQLVEPTFPVIQISDSNVILNYLFFSETLSSFEIDKVELTVKSFMKTFRVGLKIEFMCRLLDAYMRGCSSSNRIQKMITQYVKEYESLGMVDKAVEYYYNIIDFDNPSSSYFKIFELFDVDKIEGLLIRQTRSLHAFFRDFTPRFTPAQVSFLYSKCKGKSKNKTEFIRTLKDITNTTYNIAHTDVMDFDSYFRFDDVRQIFNNVVMPFVGLGNVEFEYN
jgi:hypothetical protein